MATLGESSSAPPKSTDDKPVIVRVKRKTFQSPLDAFWLEINERPLKRPLLDFENLSISDSAAEKGEFKTKKVLVQHVETLSSSEKTIDIVQSFVESSFADVSKGERKGEGRRLTFKKGNQKQDQLLSKARQEQEVLAKNARFEQIWRSRQGNQEAMHKKELDEMCRFYDVVRVDVEERSEKVKQQEDISLEDHMLLSSYLPLLREIIPSAASEIESDLHASMSKQAADDYVYDFYTVRDDMDIVHEEASYPFPIVQVDEEDYYDGPDESEYETDDSNAENNPLNDYPDEISEEEEEEKSEASENESEELESESGSDKSLESEDLDNHGLSNDADLYDDDIADDDISDGDYFDVDDDDDDGGEDWR
ncbi:hypothetical protein CMV_002483 [Castanea mollissima]|uniref:Transcription factor Iwr1 domain-containing protein n=1 Tax=Castanea mollissima TaxID=60419 RepID=A0A8J4VW46_9ROSI|nr:hypothetical protein CMV_002483 [Castanea mollissima]